MRALFTSALLAVGAFASNTKSHGPWDIMVGSPVQVKQGTVGLTTDWSKTGGADSVVEIKYTVTLTREQVMKDNTNTQKLTLWWPNDAGTSAELDVLTMPNAGAWTYKYGSVPSYDNSDSGLASATAAPDPTDTYTFVWDSQDPKKIVTQSGLPPIVSSRWNPDVGHSTNTADALNMTYYRSLNSADTTTLLSAGRDQ